jgi:hypothetical protein
VCDGGSSDLSVEKNSLGFDGFSNKESDRGKHSNTSMGQFGLTISFQSGFIGLLSKAKRVEKTSGLDDSWDGVNAESRNGDFGSSWGLLVEEGSGGSGKKGKGDDGLHCCCSI